MFGCDPPGHGSSQQEDRIENFGILKADSGAMRARRIIPSALHSPIIRARAQPSGSSPAALPTQGVPREGREG